MINKNGLTEKSKVMMKFIMKKIKNLVVDSYGQLIYIDNIDTVFYDIFGYKHFVRRINACRNNREHLSLFIDFGLEQLIQITNTQHIYSAIDELVAIDYRINELEKSFKKADKKGKKKDKNSLKEYSYIKDLYKDAIKKLKKEMNITPKKKQYKKRYGALNSLVNRSGGGFYFDDYDDDDSDYYISRVLNRTYDGYDDYDDDDDDELSAYINHHLGGKKTKKKVKSSRRFISPFDDDDDLDFYDDDEDDDDDDLDEFDKGQIMDKLDRMADGYSRLVTVVEHLADAQTGINQSESFVIENYLKKKKSSDFRAPQEQDHIQVPVSNTDSGISREVANLKRSVNTITSVLNEFAGKQDTIIQILDNITEVEDDYEDERIKRYTEAVDMINSEDEIDDEDYGDTLSREELIDIMNRVETDESSVKRVEVPGENMVPVEVDMIAIDAGAVYIDGPPPADENKPENPNKPTPPPDTPKK